MSADFETARVVVRLDVLARNFRLLRQLAGNATVAAVVKADGYGLGAAKVAGTLERQGCDTFFVARLAEGIGMRAAQPKARIFVLDGAPPEAVPALKAHHLIPVLNSLNEIAAWSAAAQGTVLDAALHVDTGMNRLGLPPDELSVLAAQSETRLANMRLVLVMSHLACSDEAAHPMNARQLSRFRAALAMLPPAPASLAASGGVLLGKDYHFDLVRPGVALYGGNPAPGEENPFQTVPLWQARVLQLRRIDKGEGVGYAAVFRAQRPTMLATVALGYADGLMRAACATGHGAIAGVRAPLAGRVSMDLATLDVTDAPCAVGDWVEFAGDTITLDEAAAAMNTNAYEVLTGFGARLPRIYTGDTA